MIDTHAHLEMLGDNQAIRGLLSRARRSGVGKVVGVADGLESSRRTAGLTEQFTNVYGVVGVHPHRAAEVDDLMMQQIWAVANQPKIVAIGETGLDFYYQQPAAAVQIKAFKAHIELAEKIGFPLVVHSRQAFDEVYEILKAARLDAGQVVIHCFTGTTEEAKSLLAIGCWLSLSGIITFHNAGPLLAAAAEIPLERLLIETDSPYLAPEPHRGKGNEPAYLSHIADKIAELKGINTADVVKATSENADKVFKF